MAMNRRRKALAGLSNVSRRRRPPGGRLYFTEFDAYSRTADVEKAFATGSCTLLRTTAASAATMMAATQDNKKTLMTVFPQGGCGYSAAVTAGRRVSLAPARAFCSSSQRLWCCLAQLTSTVPVPIASKAPSMPIVPM